MEIPKFKKFKVGDEVRMIGWRPGQGESEIDKQYIGKIGTIIEMDTCFDYAVDFHSEQLGSVTYWYEDELELV